MWHQLSSFLAWPALARQFSYAYIGGGFISSHPEPRDIDVVLETLEPYGPEAFKAVSRFFAVGLHEIEHLYGVHLHFWMQDAPSGLNDYRTFFQYDRPKVYQPLLGLRRGIVRLDLSDPGIFPEIRRQIRDEEAKPWEEAIDPVASRRSFESSEQRFPRSGVKRDLALMGQYTEEMLLLTDPEGRIEWVNPAFERTCGYTLEELRGRKPGELLQGDDSNSETIHLLRETVRFAQPCECEIVNYRKNGTPYSVRISMGPLYEAGRLEGFLAIEQSLG